MKKYTLVSFALAIFLSTMTFVSAGDMYQNPKDPIAKKQESSTMRLEYYNKLAWKGYDVSGLKPYLDGSTTTDSQFWEALKQVQNSHEIESRQAYVEKLKSKGYDVSGFTETVMWDSGKFWGMVKTIESNKASNGDVKKDEYRKIEEYKKTEERVKNPAGEVKLIPENKELPTAQKEKLRAMMQARIAKIPEAQREATLSRLETTLLNTVEKARKNNSIILAARYEFLLSVVREEMNNGNDEAIIDTLFQ